MKTVAALAVCLLAGVVAHAAQPAPAGEPAARDFVSSMPISVQGAEGLFVATLPLAVYAGSARRDLGDLRVFNGAGETVPYALLSPPTAAREKSAPVKVPIFPLWAPAGVEAGAISVRIEQGNTGAVVGVRGAEKTAGKPRLAGYIADISAIKKPIQAIIIDWKTDAGGKQNTETQGAGFSGQIDVEASDDFAHWRSRAAAAPLLTLQHQGESLALNRVEIPRVEAKYLRLSWPASQATPVFQQVQIEAVDAAIDTPRTWNGANGAPAANGEFSFDLGATAPFDRWRIELPNANTVATVKLLTRTRAEDPWLAVMSPTVYRMTRGGKEFVSPDIDTAAMPQRYWLLRLDPRTSIGPGVPRLSAGFLPQKIVFAARGAAPFTLAYGAPKVQSAAIPLPTLVPGYRDDQPLQAAAASFGDAQTQTVAAQAPWWMNWRAYDWKQITLWSVLVLGVTLLGWMALRLGSQIKPGE